MDSTNRTPGDRRDGASTLRRTRSAPELGTKPRVEPGTLIDPTDFLLDILRIELSRMAGVIRDYKSTMPRFKRKLMYRAARRMMPRVLGAFEVDRVRLSKLLTRYIWAHRRPPQRSIMYRRLGERGLEGFLRRMEDVMASPRAIAEEDYMLGPWVEECPDLVPDDGELSDLDGRVSHCDPSELFGVGDAWLEEESFDIGQ